MAGTVAEVRTALRALRDTFNMKENAWVVLHQLLRNLHNERLKDERSIREATMAEPCKRQLGTLESWGKLTDDQKSKRDALVKMLS
jgi:hypothetical protein